MSVNILASTLSSIGCRYLISEYNQVPKPVALVYNTIDMVINGLVTPYFMEKLGVLNPAAGLLVTRAFSLICAATITSFLIGPIDLAVATALTVSSLAVGLLMNLAMSPDGSLNITSFIAV